MKLHFMLKAIDERMGHGAVERDTVKRSGIRIARPVESGEVAGASELLGRVGPVGAAGGEIDDLLAPRRVANA